MLNFTKMQGLGNDFVVIDATKSPVHLPAEIIRKMSDRRYGIGFDQLLILEPSSSPSADFNYRIFNADGGEAEQCGNGARCIIKFIHEQGLSNKETITLKTLTQNIELQLQSNGDVRVNMGIPKILNMHDEIIIDSQCVHFAFLQIGNPHAIIAVDHLEQYAAMAAQISTHPHFPKGTNVEFLRVRSRQVIDLRVYERGAGWTLACGSGACAAAAAVISQNETDHHIEVRQPGGSLFITWAGTSHPLYMTGPAETVFHGTWKT
jgi:diaminopimelate epimerase